jgi:hypothetical protein
MRFKHVALTIVSVMALGWWSFVMHGSGQMEGEKAGQAAGYALGYKEGRVFQATVTPVIVQEVPVPVKMKPTLRDLDTFSTFELYDYLKDRVQRDRKREEDMTPKTF